MICGNIYSEIKRQHVADIIALRALCIAEIRQIELDAAQLASITAAMIAKAQPEELERFGEQSWENAIASLAVELWQHFSPKTTCIPNPRCLQH